MEVMSPVSSASAQGFWVERLSAQGEVLSRHRFDGCPATIGRGYDCDLIFDDPHIAPRHLLISRTADGQLQASDLGSRNGLWIGKHSVQAATATPDGDTPLRIGSTWLRLREPSHPIAEERPFVSQVRIHPGLLPLLLAVLAIGLQELTRWLGQPTEVLVLSYVTAALFMAVITLVWSGAWALATRLFTGSARFLAHLQIAFGGQVALVIAGYGLKLGAYAFSFDGLVRIGSPTNIVILATVCWLHLRVIGRSRLRLATAVVSTLAIAAIALILVQRQQSREREGDVGGLHLLMPPEVRLAAPLDEARFFAKTAKLKATLDHRREQPQPEANANLPFIETDD
jgi:hypothetical protein